MEENNEIGLDSGKTAEYDLKKYSLIDLGKYSLVIVPTAYLAGLVIQFFVRTWRFFL